MSIETRYYNIIWYVFEDESEEDVAAESRIRLPGIFVRVCPKSFIITDIRQESRTVVTLEGVLHSTTPGVCCKNIAINFYFVKESQVPSWTVCEYKIRNMADLASILRRITHRASDGTANEICKPPKEVHSGMSENGAYINMRMMDEGDLMVNREPPETSTNFIMTLTTNLTKIFNGEKEVLKSMIKSVTINEKKKVTTVVFTDGDVQMAKCSKNDEYDKTVGISICIAAHLAGSKEKLKKFVKEITEK